MLVAVLAQPSSVWADAIGTGDPMVAGSPGGIPSLIGFVAGIAALGLVIATLIALGYGVARIGGPPAPSDGPGTTEPPSAGARFMTRLAGIFLAVAATGGFLAGRAAAGASSEGGLSAIFATVYLVFFGGAVVVGLVIVGLAATAFRRGHVSRAIATIFLAAALVVSAAFVGEVTARVTGGLPHMPLVLRADAGLHVELDASSLSFTPRDGGQAECRSGPDSRTVSDLSGLDLGELGPGTLRVGLTLGSGDPGTASAEFFIDGGDLPEGLPMITWAGTVAATSTGPGSSTGQMTFTALPLSRSDAKPGLDPSPPSSELAWPSTLSGTLTWTCDAWTN